MTDKPIDTLPQRPPIPTADKHVAIMKKNARWWEKNEADLLNPSEEDIKKAIANGIEARKAKEAADDVKTGKRPSHRVCKTCGEEKPLTLEYFWSRPSCRNGLDIHCKVCRQKKQSPKKNKKKVGRPKTYKLTRTQAHILSWLLEDNCRKIKRTKHAIKEATYERYCLIDENGNIVPHDLLPSTARSILDQAYLKIFTRGKATYYKLSKKGTTRIEEFMKISEKKTGKAWYNCISTKQISDT